MTSLLLDISRLFHRRFRKWLPTGIDRVSLEYVRHYAGRARAVLGVRPFFSVLSPSESSRAFGALLGSDASGADFAALVGRAYLRWWTRPEIEGGVLLNTTHTALESAGYASWLGRRGVRPVFFLHDLIPITHPQHCRPGERERHVRRVQTAVTVGCGIIVPSQHTLDTLRRYCNEAGWPLPPATVAPLASSLPRIAAGPRPLPQPYFVVVGTIELRKNIPMLLEAWRGLVGRLGDGAPRLLIIGQRGYGHDGVVDLLGIRELRGCVIERGSFTDGELVTWLTHAQALLFPSFEEGYGLPLAEALALGVPAITADLPVFREVAGDIPEYADARDGRRWSELIDDYAQPDSGLRAAQLRRLAGFQPTSWQRHFETVDAFLASLE